MSLPCGEDDRRRLPHGAFSFRIQIFLVLTDFTVPMHRYSSPKEALKQVFGYDAFRGFQEEVVRAVVRGEDV